MPAMPCTEIAPTGSSTPSFSNMGIESVTIRPATRPTTTDQPVAMRSGAAVMPTKPPRAPLSVMPGSGRPSFLDHAVNMAPMAPAAADSVVVTATEAKSAPTAASVEPALNPYQPNQRMNTPSAPSMSEWPGIAFGLPFSSYLPIRGPMVRTPARAATPPTRWTMPEPAKS